MAKLHWASLGTGVIANELAEALAGRGDVLYSVANRTYDKAVAFAEKYGVSKVYDNMEDVFEDPEVDVIYISTPHNTHIRYLRKALAAGKHVLCEKSITLNSEELDEALGKYHSLQDDALTLDPDELLEARLAIRPEQEDLAIRKLQDAYGTKYDPEIMRRAKTDVADLLQETPLDEKDRSILDRLHEKQHEQHTQQNRSRSRKKANEQEL